MHRHRHSYTQKKGSWISVVSVCGENTNFILQTSGTWNLSINLNSMNKKRIPMEIKIVFVRSGSIKTTIRLLVNATQRTMIIRGIIGASLFPDRMVGRHTSISNANNAAEIKYVGSIFWLIFSMIIILFPLFPSTLNFPSVILIHNVSDKSNGILRRTWASQWLLERWLP